ncbi:MAG: ABC transporter ATP-binding protein [Thalassobaculales bacterium]
MSAPLLEIAGLRTEFRTAHGAFPAVDGVDLAVAAGETVAVVGESGCGKSVLAQSVMGLLPRPGARIAAGSIRLDGQELVGLREGLYRRLRGKAMSIVFQEPMTSLNPVLTVGRQIAEVLTLHEGLSAAAAHRRAVEMLALVRMPDPEERARAYPHQLSGGMRQRVVIAVALACRPRLLIADEPTTALDVTVQAQILNLLLDLQDDLGTALLLITHDLGVVAETAERVVVMYAGRVVETATTAALFAAPRHPYTRGLMRALPGRGRGVGERLQDIPGMVPGAAAARIGCLFAPRCGLADARCRQQAPPLAAAAEGHQVACWHAGATA